MTLPLATAWIFTGRLAASPTYFVGSLRMVTASIAAVLTDALTGLSCGLGCDHGLILCARVFVLLVSVGDRAFAGFIAAAPFLGFPSGIAALMLRGIALRIWAGALALVAGAFVGNWHSDLLCQSRNARKRPLFQGELAKAYSDGQNAARD
jgi:hypothetical protein